MKRTRRSSPKNKILFAVALIFIAGFFIPTPYYLFQPGSVEELSSKVTVENGVKDSKGELHLTTVMSVKASNLFIYAYGLVSRHTEIRRIEEVRGDFTDKEYERLNVHMMESSQNNAIVAGLRAAGEPVNIKSAGVFVRSITKESEAKGKLEVGDIITEVDGKKVEKASDFMDELKDKTPSDQVEIKFHRANEEKKLVIGLIPLKNGANKYGVGIVPEDQFTIDTPDKTVIHAGDIGGPSAGLMFSLEIYDQLKKGDLTKGYQIAGTGTIDIDGNVGQIGGIREKIVAVEKAGMDIFFCPKDVLSGDTNEKDVKEVAEREGYHVKIVPVQNMEEAIAYLDKLPPKK